MSIADEAAILKRHIDLCLAKIKSAFGINNIKKGMQQCYMPCGFGEITIRHRQVQQ
jgi:hypothetical protein